MLLSPKFFYQQGGYRIKRENVKIVRELSSFGMISTETVPKPNRKFDNFCVASNHKGSPFKNERRVFSYRIVDTLFE